MPGMKLRVMKSLRSSYMANSIWWAFHWSRSWILSYVNMFIAFRYIPKKMCSLALIQSLSTSCHAETFLPRTLRVSYTVGTYPLPLRYLAHGRPAIPPPLMAMVFRFSSDTRRVVLKLSDRVVVLRYMLVSSTFGLGKFTILKEVLLFAVVSNYVAARVVRAVRTCPMGQRGCSPRPWQPFAWQQGRCCGRRSPHQRSSLG